MSVTGPALTDDVFAELTFGDKLSLSKVLFRSYGLTVMALMLLAFLVLGLIVLAGLSGMGFTRELALGIFQGDDVVVESLFGSSPWVVLLFMAAGLVTQFILIGLDALVLIYIDTQGPASATLVFLSPWKRFGTIFLGLLLWAIIYILTQLFLGIFEQFPVLGLAIAIGLALAFNIFLDCARFYIADMVLCQNQQLALTEAVAGPVSVVVNNTRSWLAAYGFMIIIYLVLFVILTIGMAAELLILTICSILALVVASVYSFFLFGVTYRQSLARYRLLKG